MNNCKIIALNSDVKYLDIIPGVCPNVIEKMRISRQVFPHTQFQDNENTNK